MQPFVIVVLLSWMAFVVYWLSAARQVKRPRVRQPAWRRVIGYAGMVVVALLLVGTPVPELPILGLRVFPHGTLAGWAGAGLCVAGLCFAIWARLTIADNWSADVQIKEGHELVTTGPYRLVRHPIYAGIVTMLAGTWMLAGSLGSLIGIALGFVAVWRKLHMEENYMRREFPGEYPQYAARVKRLIPGVF